jgi:hypothetical protein
MRRDVWDWLGGWIRLPGYWAGEEQIMTLLAYRFGIPIHVLTNHTCLHREYRQHGKYPFELPAHHPVEIAYYIHRACFPETYEKAWKPVLDKRFGGYQPQADAEPLRQWIDKRAVWSEHRVMETVLGCQDITQHELVAHARGA